MAQSGFGAWLDRKFLFAERKTNFWQEFRGALATFLTMSYILLVNPQLLYKVIHVSPELVVMSTALASASGCFWAGYFGNMPLGLAPGIGLSAYLSYGLILGQGLTRQEAFTSCFISGIILLICSLTGISKVLMKFIPRSVKLATIVGMGLQIALVGMTSVQLVVPNKDTIVGLGPIDNYQIWLSMFGLVLIGSLLFHQVEGGILIGIAVMTLITWTVEGSFPSRYVQLPQLDFHVSDFIDFTNYDVSKCASGIAAFLFIGLIDVSGVIFGMASLANITKPDGSIPGASATFVAVSLGTLVSAVTGGTPIIVYVESASGIKDGGRTGLTAIFIGFFFLLAIFLAPILASIPLAATSPVAMLIGAMMMSQAGEVDWENMSDAIPAFLTLIIMPFTFSITNGIVFGLIAAFSFYITTGQCLADLRQFVNSTRSNNDSGAAITDGNGVTELTKLTSSHNNTSTLTRTDSADEDFAPVVRTPSLILAKSEAELVRKAHGHRIDEEVYAHTAISNAHSHQHVEYSTL